MHNNNFINIPYCVFNFHKHIISKNKLLIDLVVCCTTLFTCNVHLCVSFALLFWKTINYFSCYNNKKLSKSLNLKPFNWYIEVFKLSLTLITTIFKRD
jgi:hypothetical protein